MPTSGSHRAQYRCEERTCVDRVGCGASLDPDECWSAPGRGRGLGVGASTDRRSMDSDRPRPVPPCSDATDVRDEGAGRCSMARRPRCALRHDGAALVGRRGGRAPEGGVPRAERSAIDSELGDDPYHDQMGHGRRHQPRRSPNDVRHQSVTRLCDPATLGGRTGECNRQRHPDATNGAHEGHCPTGGVARTRASGHRLPQRVVARLRRRVPPGATISSADAGCRAFLDPSARSSSAAPVNVLLVSTSRFPRRGPSSRSAAASATRQIATANATLGAAISCNTSATTSSSSPPPT